MAFTYKNEQEINDAIADVRNDRTDTNWTLISYENTKNPDTLILKGSGSGGVEEMKAALEADNCSYGIARIEEMIDNSLTVKFVYLKFLGEKTRPMFRARLTTQTEAVQRKFDPHHVTLIASTVDEISQEIFEKLVSDASMSKSKEISSRSVPKTTLASSEITVTPSSTNSHSNTASKTATATTTTTTGTSTQTASVKGAQIDIQSEVDAAIRDVRNDETETDWCLAGYVDDEKKVVGLIGNGSGGLEELKQHLSDDNMNYGLLRVTDKVDESMTVKFVGIVHVGEKVKPTHRARIVTHRGVVQSHFSPFHVDVTVSSADELQFTEIMRLVQETSGSGSRVVDSSTGKSQSHLTAANAASGRSEGALASRKTRRGSTHLLSFGDVDGIRAEVADLRDDETETNWIALGYIDGSRDRVGFINKGNGGVMEMRQLFEEDKVFYCLTRHNELIDESVTTKFCLVQWLGERVNPMLKARVSTHKGPVTELLGQSHVSLFATDIEEVTEEAIDLLISKASMSYNWQKA